MPQVASWDYDNRRVHLSFDTVSAGVDFAAAYLEERAYRDASGEDVRGKRPMMRGDGRLPKSAGKFTPQFVTFLEGARPVPYDASHTLTLLTEPIADDGTTSGTGIIDRSPLSPGVEVNVEVGYEQVEIVTVPTGGALTAEQANQLAQLWATLASSGVFDAAAFANLTTGGLTTEQANQLQLLFNFRGLNAAQPITGDDSNTTIKTETDGTVTITHTISGNTVTSQRSG